MPKIRTIKPNFWDSPDVARASLRARLLYIAMWNWADDWGVGDAHLDRLMAFAFPNDDVTPPESRQLLTEVRREFGVIFFEFEGRPYYYIRNWEKHQKIDRRTPQRVPVPEHEDEDLFSQFTSQTGESHAIPPESRGNSAVEVGSRKREVGSRKKEEHMPGAADAAQGDRPPTPFDQFYDAYPRHVGRRKAEAAWAAATKRADPQTIINGARRFAADPNLPGENFIPHPTTWLNRDGWEDDPLPDRNTENRTDTITDRMRGWIDPNMFTDNPPREIVQ
jgi:hypothetical protein